MFYTPRDYDNYSVSNAIWVVDHFSLKCGLQKYIFVVFSSKMKGKCKNEYDIKSTGFQLKTCVKISAKLLYNNIKLLVTLI